MWVRTSLGSECGADDIKAIALDVCEISATRSCDEPVDKAQNGVGRELQVPAKTAHLQNLVQYVDLLRGREASIPAQHSLHHRLQLHHCQAPLQRLNVLSQHARVELPEEFPQVSRISLKFADFCVELPHVPLRYRVIGLVRHLVRTLLGTNAIWLIFRLRGL